MQKRYRKALKKIRICGPNYYPTIFEGFLPSASTAKTVAYEASVACSTAKALELDDAWKNMNDPSSRAGAGVYMIARIIDKARKLIATGNCRARQKD